MRTEVDGKEIKFALGEKAEAEMAERHPDFIEWLADDPRTVKAVAAFLAREEIEALLLLSGLKYDYIAHRKNDADEFEQEQIAGYILDAEREGVHDY